MFSTLCNTNLLFSLTEAIWVFSQGPWEALWGQRKDLRTMCGGGCSRWTQALPLSAQMGDVQAQPCLPQLGAFTECLHQHLSLHLKELSVSTGASPVTFSNLSRQLADLPSVTSITDMGMLMQQHMALKTSPCESCFSESSRNSSNTPVNNLVIDFSGYECITRDFFLGYPCDLSP